MRSQALMFAQSVGLTCHDIGQPTDQLVKVRGIMTTKKLKAGSVARKRVCTHVPSWRILRLCVNQNPALQTRCIHCSCFAGKTIARIPKIGGLFSPEQLPQSAAWPALKFMQQQVHSVH